ncbi:CocE/NonD family hydrolase C-terminal non-catalytic domain-containing protein [Streptomyces thermocarboxydus]
MRRTPRRHQPRRRRRRAAGIGAVRRPRDRPGREGPLEPGRAYEIAVDLWSTAHTFLPGHRIRVDIAPSSSPRWDVGANSYAPDGESAPAVTAEHTILQGPGRPSRIVLDVVTSPV